MKGFSKMKLLGLLSIALIIACAKDDGEQGGYLTPIMITSPSTNPSELKTNTPVSYAATFTIDTIIDSVRVKYIVDSTNIGNNEDSLKYYRTYTFARRYNVQTITDVLGLTKYPPINGYIRIKFELYTSKRSKIEKWLTIKMI
jgi:hypothetical protein